MRDLSASHLSWRPSGEDRLVTDDISVSFQAGEMIGILGANGSGKTSLIRQLMKLIVPTSGKVYADGRDVADMRAADMARLIAFMPQDTGLDVGFSVEEVVAMGRAPYMGRFQQLSREDALIVATSLRLVGCEELSGRRVDTLSGGERQRVLMARTIAQRTPYIILDEPVASLDIRYQVESMNMLERLRHEEGVTVIAVMHDLNLAYRYCSRVILLKAGRLVAEGSPSEVMIPKLLEEAYGIGFRIQKLCDDGVVILPSY